MFKMWRDEGDVFPMTQKGVIGDIQKLLNKIDICMSCGKLPETKHHTPPKCINPKLTIKIPICKECHHTLNTGKDYTAKEKRSLRANIRKIEKSTKNIRNKILDK